MITTLMCAVVLCWSFPPPPVFEPARTCVREERVMRISYYGPTGFTMANGKYPKYGFVATSDRTIKLGTKIKVEGIGVFEVGDRTALWVHEKLGDTIDVFMEESDQTLIKKGVSKNKVIIYEKC